MRWENLAEWERELSVVLEAVQDARRVDDFDHESKQKAFESGITPVQFVRGYASASVTATSPGSGDTDAPLRPPQVATSGIMPFDASLLEQGSLSKGLPRTSPPGTSPLQYRLCGYLFLVSGVGILIIATAGAAYPDEGFALFETLLGLAFLFIGLRCLLKGCDPLQSQQYEKQRKQFEEQSQQVVEQVPTDWKRTLKATGRNLAAMSYFGRRNQPVGAIAACEDAPEVLIVAGTSPVMAIQASKIRSAEAVEDKVSLGVGGAVNIQGIWLGGLLPASYTKYTGVTILLDDLRYPRLNIEFPTLAEAAQWEDILNVLRART